MTSKGSTVIWQLNTLFSNLDRDQYQKLSNFCQKKILPVQSALENSSDSFIHKVISFLSSKKEEDQLNFEIIKILLENNCGIGHVNSVGDPPLLAAVKEKKMGVIKAFLEHGCDVNVVDRYGKTILIFAAQNNNVDMVKLILKYGKNVSINVTDLSQHSALSFAVHNDNIAICNLLFGAGANPNASAMSPLYLAVRNDCSIEMIRLLLEKGAAVNVWIDFTGFNTLTAAAYKNRTEAVEALIEGGAHFTNTWFSNRSFIAALERDNLDIINLFLSRGVKIDCNNFKGSNILHEAASHGSLKILKFVIEKTNIDIDRPDRYEKSAFHLAAQEGHVECLKTLFLSGANGLTRERKGLTPLEAAIFHNHKDCVMFMVLNQVLPRRVLFSVCQVLERDYDQAVFSQIKAMTTFKAHMVEFDDHVDSLFMTCVFRLRQLLGQRPMEKIPKLALPNKLKNAIYDVEV